MDKNYIYKVIILILFIVFLVSVDTCNGLSAQTIGEIDIPIIDMNLPIAEVDSSFMSDEEIRLRLMAKEALIKEQGLIEAKTEDLITSLIIMTAYKLIKNFINNIGE